MANDIPRVRRCGAGPLLLLGFLAGCSTMPTQAPLATVRSVDLPRFMGTTFTFRKGGFEGPQKRYTPKGFIVDSQTNATWGMRFIWPIKAEYLILDLGADYSTTIIGRNKRDYLWIMARTPVLADDQYAALVRKAVSFGYDAALIRKVPQRQP